MKKWSDENEKLVGKFLRASGAQKKGFPNFLLAAAFFVVEALKTAKKLLKTSKNRYIFQKTSIFF